jgi:acyl dehydratase
MNRTSLLLTQTRRRVCIGDEHSITRRFNAGDVETFGKLVGDTNPIHLDVAAARSSGFRRCVVHGMLVSGLFSTLMGMHLPGPRSIYTTQSLKFVAPVYVGDEVTATVKVMEIDEAKCDVVLETTVRRTADGKLCVVGRGIGRNKFLDFGPASPAKL